MYSIILKASRLSGENGYRGAPLILPADKGAMLDALDIARVPYGSGGYKILPGGRVPAFMKKMLENRPSLAEMNHLAERLTLLTDDELDKLEGVLKIRDSYAVSDVINATHNLNRFVQHPVFDDAELGEIAMESPGMYEPLEQVPDELLDCIDREMVGELIRKRDGGVFTNGGYVMRENDGWEEVYDGHSLAGRTVTLEPGDPVITLEIAGADHSQRDVQLDLPASEDDVKKTLASVGAKSLEECAVMSVRSVIPAFNCSHQPSQGAAEFNRLAQAIYEHCGTRLAKYKAVLDFEDAYDIEAAISLTARLHEYDFEPYPSTAELGRAALAKTGADVKLAQEYGFDFDAYGQKTMDEQGIRFLTYGFISHPRGREQSLEPAGPVPEPDRAFEQTMGM